jgi:hypothetical protein
MDMAKGAAAGKWHFRMHVRLHCFSEIGLMLYHFQHGMAELHGRPGYKSLLPCLQAAPL